MPETCSGLSEGGGRLPEQRRDVYRGIRRQEQGRVVGKLAKRRIHQSLHGEPVHSSTLGIMPMMIASLGNSSVATIPTLLDLIHKKKLEQQSILPGDKVVFASVGAGMNINASIYQF